MKLIISGASGLVGRELVRQSLALPAITAVIALARTPLAVPPPEDLPPGADATKLRSVVVAGYDAYPDHVRNEFAGAGACIWTVAVTPQNADALPFDEVTRVCQTCTLAGLEAMTAAGPAAPFRFLYLSGVASERDQSRTDMWWKSEYRLMRGETENRIHAFAAASPGGAVQAAVAKLGFVSTPADPWLRTALGTALQYTFGLPGADVGLLAAALLDQAVRGFERDELSHADLERIGTRARMKLRQVGK